MRKILLSLFFGCLVVMTNGMYAAPVNAVPPTLNPIKKYIKEGDYAAALKAVNSYIDATPNDPVGYKIRANIHFFQKNYNEALVDFNRVVELKPESAQARENRAGTYLALKDYDRALEDVEKALEIRPKSPFALALKHAILEEKSPAKGPKFRVRNKGERLR